MGNVLPKDRTPAHGSTPYVGGERGVGNKGRRTARCGGGGKCFNIYDWARGLAANIHWESINSLRDAISHNSWDSDMQLIVTAAQHCAQMSTSLVKMRGYMNKLK